MKRRFAGLLAILLFALAAAGAYAETSFEGTVVAGETKVVQAPYGGIVKNIRVRAGEPVEEGSVIASFDTTKVYATDDGTISGIFAQEGDSTEGIVERYGGVMYIEPTNRYIVSADNEKSYNSSAARYVHIGEQVYIKCVKDGSHRALGVISAVSEQNESGHTPFKVEVTGGELYMGEEVAVYRSSSYTAESRIGRGTVAQNAAIAIKGSGSVLKMHVKEGEKVERGQLLFETVEGTLDGLYPLGSEIASDVAGIVASVDVAPGAQAAKGAKLITVYPVESFQVEVLVSEMDLGEIHEGDKVTMEFEWDYDSDVRLEGTVAMISRVDASTKTTENGAATTTAASTTAKYSAYIDFDPGEDVRLGMSVIVYVEDPEEEAEYAEEAAE